MNNKLNTLRNIQALQKINLITKSNFHHSVVNNSDNFVYPITKIN